MVGVRHPPKRAICVHLSWVPCCRQVHSRVPIRDGDAHAIPEVGEGATLGPAYYYVSRYRPLEVSPAYHQSGLVTCSIFGITNQLFMNTNQGLHKFFLTAAPSVAHLICMS